MDLSDFDDAELYFGRPPTPQAQELIESASARYADVATEAERCLRAGAAVRLGTVTAFDPGDRLGARSLQLMARGVELLPYVS